MCLSCLAGLTTEVPKLHSARRKATDSATKVPSWPTKAPSLPHQPIQAASLEPKLGRSLADEVIRRERAEAEAAALQCQLEHERGRWQELERNLAEVEGRTGNASSLLRSRILALQAQLDDERSRSRHLQARLLVATPRSARTDPALQASARGDISERIAREREICNVQAQLIQEMSKRSGLQLQLELRASRDFASLGEEVATTPRRQTTTGTLSTAPSSASSSTHGSSEHCFGGSLAKQEKPFQWRISPRTPLAASAGARHEYGHLAIGGVGTSSCSTTRSTLDPGTPTLACVEV